MNKNKFEIIPVEEAIRPKNGATVYTNKYWAVLDGCVLFFRGFAPQCNANKELAEMVVSRLYPDAEIELLDCVYHHERAF